MPSAQNALVGGWGYIVLPGELLREEHSMEQYRSRLKHSENFEPHWSILISGEIHMDQSVVHTFSWGNSYGPMVLKVLLKFPPTLVLLHGWLFPVAVLKDDLPDKAEYSGPPLHFDIPMSLTVLPATLFGADPRSSWLVDKLCDKHRPSMRSSNSSRGSFFGLFS